MSELIDIKNRQKATNRRWLLTTTSVLVLFSAACEIEFANAQESASQDPTVWIELGGQLERVDGGQMPFSPPFMSPPPAFVTQSPLVAQRLPRYSNGAEGKITFSPAETNWVFEASVRYGRSNAVRHNHESQFVKFPSINLGGGYVYITPLNKKNDFDDVMVKHVQNHVVVDFMAGRDVGLGVFGASTRGVVSAGMRFAQFNSRSEVNMKATPDLSFYDPFPPSFPFHIGVPRFHNYEFDGSASRSFRGAGPTLTWNAQSRVAGNRENEELSVDWGLNAAVLFGRQKSAVSHETKGGLYQGNAAVLTYYPPATYYQHLTSRKRSHSVVVPNLGGFAGLSLRFPNAKVSIGYRADFFFDAIDGGIDTRKTYDRNFYGPFATIGVGLGG